MISSNGRYALDFIFPGSFSNVSNSRLVSLPYICLTNPHLNDSLPVIRDALLGLEVALATYALEKYNPSDFSLLILGVSNTGLLYPKSAQPRSSTNRITILGCSFA